MDLFCVHMLFLQYGAVGRPQSSTSHEVGEIQKLVTRIQFKRADDGNTQPVKQLIFTHVLKRDAM